MCLLLLLQGGCIDVPLVRMPTEMIADRRRLFELFTSLKDRAILDKDIAGGIIDETIALWSKMVLADMVHDQKIEENVQEIQVDPLSSLWIASFACCRSACTQSHTHLCMHACMFYAHACMHY